MAAVDKGIPAGYSEPQSDIEMGSVDVCAGHQATCSPCMQEGCRVKHVLLYGWR